MYRISSLIKLHLVLLCFCVLASCGERKGSGKPAADTLSATNPAREISRQIEQDGSNPELYYQRAVIYFNEQHLDRSLLDIDQAIVYDKQNPLYYYFKARILYAMNQTLKAADAYEQAIRLKPDYTEAKLKVAELYYVVKEHQKSLRYLNAIIEQEPGNAVAYFFKGMNQKELKDTVRAIGSFQSAFENDKNFYDAAMQLGLLYAVKNTKIALEYYSAAVRIDPRNDDAYFARAVLFQQSGKYKEALTDYRKVIGINPSNDDAYYNVGYINFETKHYDEALRNWNTCIQMNNTNVKAYYMRGLVHEMKKNKEDAKLNYQYALGIDPGFELAKAGLKRIR